MGGAMSSNNNNTDDFSSASSASSLALVEGFDDGQVLSLLKSQQVKTLGLSSRAEMEAKVSEIRLPLDLTLVRSDIKNSLRDRNHDDGSYVPLLIRFAWHNAGTYDKDTNTGGPNGSTMRFDEEANDPENAGLGKAMRVLEPIKRKWSFLSYADIWMLAGCVAIEASGGPRVPFSYGRRDFTEEEALQKNSAATGSRCPFGDGRFNPNKSRLPTADRGQDKSAPKGCPMHVLEKPTIDGIRGPFTRMGFTDKETVCLILLGHQYGRCHADVSGYENPWYSFDPAHYNIYEHGLGYLSIYNFGVAQGQHRKRITAQGKRQWEMAFGGGEPFMMLPTDMALWWDPNYQEYVKAYDRDRVQFKRDAVKTFKKLIELGCEDMLTQERC
mmetsp:Transcript_23406/g.44039  ORF Transcript_23406/g.44039 Transcript_23406/m.44039 type:complete len:384 (-) Transcript_23406:17-1168(-)